MRRMERTEVWPLCEAMCKADMVSSGWVTSESVALLLAGLGWLLLLLLLLLLLSLLLLLLLSPSGRSGEISRDFGDCWGAIGRIWSCGFPLSGKRT